MPPSTSEIRVARTLSRRTFLRGSIGATTLVAASGAYAFGIEPAILLRVTSYRPSLPAWPTGFGLKIAALADIHVAEPYMPLARVEEIVAATNALKPDLIVLLGDYANAHRLITRRVPLPDFARVAAGLRAPLGTFAILGNHDWWDDEKAQRERRGPVEAARVLEANGIRVFENDGVRLVKDGRPFWLLGLGDQLAFFDGHGEFEGREDLPATLARMTDDAPAILLAHEPDIFPHVPARVAVTLSGHTHGGQVRLFGYSPVVPSEFGNRYAYGHVVEDGRHLIVSGGLGTSKLPIRVGVPPEIVELTLGGAEQGRPS